MKKSLLLTNDDGYQSIGFYPLLRELSIDYNVIAVVPDGQRSWMGKSISKDKKLTIKEVVLGEFKVLACSGTPADCTQIGLYDFFETKPDLVLSGINIGTNVGHGYILSSGTVGAAIEAAIDGVKAVSVSFYIPPSIRPGINFFDPNNYHVYENAAKITRKVSKIMLENEFDKEVDLISVNIPYEGTENSQFEVTKPFREGYGKLFVKKDEVYIHQHLNQEMHNRFDGTDMKAVSEGKVSITPINLDLVSKNSMESVKEIFNKNWH